MDIIQRDIKLYVYTERNINYYALGELKSLGYVLSMDNDNHEYFGENIACKGIRLVQSSIKATIDMDLLNKHNIYLNTDNKILIIGKAIMIDLNKKTINALTGKEMADYMAKPRSDRKQLIIRNQ
jgi:hypothetical protein